MNYIKLMVVISLIIGCMSFYAKQQIIIEPVDNQTKQDLDTLKKVVVMQKKQLFIYDECPYCDKVILFLKKHNLLDQVELVDVSLDANLELLKKISKKTQVPYLVDQDAQISMPESSDIIEYFIKKYDLKENESKSPVVSLSNVDNTQKKYDVNSFLSDVIQSQKPVVILVSTTWCPPCKSFKPVFLQVAQMMSEDCEFICLDGDINQDILIKLEISSYPTVVYYKNGQRVYLTDERTQKKFTHVVKQFIQN